jgi:hypothetical protein
MTVTEVLESRRAEAPPYRGNDRLVLGIVLAVITFWLFAQTTLNVAPVIRDDLRISTATSDLAVSITALFSGIFIIVAGDIAESLRPSAVDVCWLGPQCDWLVAHRRVTDRNRGLLARRACNSRSLGCLYHAVDACAHEGVLRGESSSARVELLVDRIVGRLGAVRVVWWPGRLHARLHSCATMSWHFATTSTTVTTR